MKRLDLAKISFFILWMIPLSTSWSQEIASDSTKIKHCNLKDPSVYYEINNIDNPENLDIDLLMESFKEYPTIRIEYIQAISKKEKPGIAKKRIRAFKLLLEKNGVPTSNITFSDHVYYLDELEPDQRSRIQGRVVSLE